jgi:diguanylate cyclase
MRSPRWHWSWWALAIGLVASVAAFLSPDGVTGAWAYLVAALLGVGLSVVGATRVPEQVRPVWRLLALGQVLYFGGDVIWTLLEEYVGVYPTSSPADLLYLSRYGCVVAALLAAVRGRRRPHDRAALLDAAIISTGFGVLFAVFFVLPSAQGGAGSVLDQAVAAAYPCADFAVLAVFVTLFTSGSVRTPASWALVLALVTMLLVDVPFLVSVTDGLHYPGLLDLGWLLTYVFFGFAAVHPSAARLADPGPEAVARISRTRVALLGVAMMLAPVTDEVAHLIGYEQSSHLVLVGGLVSTTLVLLRLWDLLGNLERKADELAGLARVDGLTGVPNRRTWDHELARACRTALEAHEPLVVAILDLDRFKAYNDAHGHLMGDLVLKETATAWHEILDGTGFLARFGGEEFSVLLPGHRLDAAEPVLERLRATMPGGQSCSIGVAVWDFSEDPADVVARADRALYFAKHAGRDRIAVHDGVATRELRAPRTAGVESLLSTVFQPIVCLATGEPAAFEALSRFSNGNPQDVFDSAVLHGTQASLEAAALRSALAAWDGTLPVSLNLSGATLCTPEVTAALEGDLSHVILELTESDSAASSAAALAVVDDLRARGARIAVDDFGVGFSNVERVALLNPDLLKLDMSLVRGIDRNTMLQAVVRGCLAYVEETGALICAEGIETAAELQTLVELGVQLGQGYLLGRPQPYEHYDGCTDLAGDVPRDLFSRPADRAGTGAPAEVSSTAG